MKHDLAQDIALMRYSMISPLIIVLPNEYDSKEINSSYLNWNVVFLLIVLSPSIISSMKLIIALQNKESSSDIPLTCKQSMS